MIKFLLIFLTKLRSKNLILYLFPNQNICKYVKIVYSWIWVDVLWCIETIFLSKYIYLFTLWINHLIYKLNKATHIILFLFNFYFKTYICMSRPIIFAKISVFFYYPAFIYYLTNFYVQWQINTYILWLKIFWYIQNIM